MADASNYTAMTAAVVAIVDGAITSNVYARQMLTHDMAAFVSQFVVGGKVDVWTVSRSAAKERRRTNQRTERKITWTLRAFMSVDNAAASETTFQTNIELVCDAFRADYDLAGTAESHGLLQIARVVHAPLGNVFCHYCESTVTSMELLVGNI